MNKIKGILKNSDYEDYWDFINYQIDGYWLDEKLDELYPDNMFKGLIPTLVYWMERDDEKEVVWNRILPNENETMICPILMCPDDNDFSCTLIVAEIKNYGQIIQWKKIGIDKTKEWDAEKVGSTVEWFEKLTELNFSKQDYLTMIETFKQQFLFDKLRIEENIKK
ncbi:hypothetical protein GKZ90_0010020 [Flavobacterium sp. MC2016-06]|jgi:hypothetical protein|uniref:hypothetical protein n=1 Tax=Flavobacterium sp. MC2016-06 TaxID=2676308 RepID=UPI0012BA852A|nr:hypothetical protein [Flavobacterium sp. MC2016-06]MBU3859746.1 hypothetical protein [Flavobacterium sp. MC2016-06]